MRKGSVGLRCRAVGERKSAVGCARGRLDCGRPDSRCFARPTSVVRGRAAHSEVAGAFPTCRRHEASMRSSPRRARDCAFRLRWRDHLHSARTASPRGRRGRRPHRRLHEHQRRRFARRRRRRSRRCRSSGREPLAHRMPRLRRARSIRELLADVDEQSVQRHLPLRRSPLAIAMPRWRMHVRDGHRGQVHVHDAAGCLQELLPGDGGLRPTVS